MNKLFSQSIKSLLFVMVSIMAFFAAGIIVYSGISFRSEKISEALKDSAILADSVYNEHDKMVADARQLMLTLAQLSEIRSPNSAGMQPVLKEVLRVNPKYSNIFIADRTGRVMASAVPARDTNVSDRRYFINALATRRFSSGEFIVSRFTGRPVLSFGYPFMDRQGEILGVIVMGIDMRHYRPLLDTLQLPSGSSYLLLDYKGTIMTRGINPTDFIGEQYDPDGFKRMTDGPDRNTFVAVAHDGIKRFISYRKIRLDGELVPYMYIRSGIPVAAALSIATKALVRNLTLLTTFLCFVVVLIWLIAKRSIIDRIALLEKASKRLADGDFHVKVSDLVAGGELGRLGLTFDHMARQIALREEALRESEQRYYTLFEQSPDGILLIDTAGKIIGFNETAHRQLGYSQEEFAKLSLSDIDPVESPEEIQTNIEKIMHEGKAEFVAKHRTKQGEDRDVNIITKVIVLSGRQVMYAIWHDITAQCRMEAEMQKMQKLESLGLLAGGLAHDFNNLLTGIIGNISIVQMHLSPGHKDYDCLSAAETAAERATDLTQQLLTFAKGGAPIKKVIPIADLVRESVDFALSGSNVSCNYIIPAGLWNTEADRGQMAQVFNNLSINAVHAMYGGGIVNVSMENLALAANSVPPLPEGDYIKIIFSDCGTGIPEKHLSKIFDPYFTTKKQGSGLGLATVFSILKKHDGYITAESKVGEGTRFVIYLPATKNAVHAVSSAKDSLSIGYGNVLVMDDEKLVRDLAGGMLMTLGYKVQFAEDGEKALALYKKALQEKKPFRVLIMDLTIPGGMGGREALGKILEIDPEAKVIASSGYSTDPVMSEYKKYGFCGVLSKPYNIEQMSNEMQRVCKTN